MTWCELQITQCAQVLHYGTWNKNDHAMPSTGTRCAAAHPQPYSHAEPTQRRDDTNAGVNQYATCARWLSMRGNVLSMHAGAAQRRDPQTMHSVWGCLHSD
jgi:hypothetical protein